MKENEKTKSYKFAVFCLFCIMTFSSTSVTFAETGTDPNGNDYLTKSNTDATYFEEDDVNEFLLNQGVSLNEIQNEVSAENYLNELKQEITSKYDPEQIESIEAEIRADYMTDPEYLKQLEETDGIEAEIMIMTIVKNELDETFAKKITKRSANSSFAWVVAPNVKQCEYYYCGPASALQSIAGWKGYVKGNTNEKKQRTLASAMGTTSEGTTYYALAKVLNQYASNYPYGYIRGNSMDVNQFLNTCYDSLADDYAPIIHCKTGKLPYYKGHNTGHYITISGADLSTNKIRLVDPNYRPKYFGIRTLDASDVFKSINIGGRYLISANI